MNKEDKLEQIITLYDKYYGFLHYEELRYEFEDEMDKVLGITREVSE